MIRGTVKRLGALLLVTALAAGMTACGGAGAGEQGSTSGETIGEQSQNTGTGEQSSTASSAAGSDATLLNESGGDATGTDPAAGTTKKDDRIERRRQRADAATERPEGGNEAAATDAVPQMIEFNKDLPVNLPVNLPDDACRTTYEIFVYSFYDSDGDGIGDLKGVDEKLDYVNDNDPSTGTDLGATEIWLMPISPSPTYHKYDVTDYTAIDPEYGTMEDFEQLVADAHERGIRVITDMVMNHTSTEHPWFREAAAYLEQLPEGAEPEEKACPYVTYYNFSREKLDGYVPLAGSDWYYEARFWEGMPDLNLDNPKVRDELRDIAAFWLDKGVDGFRLDATTSYYTDDTGRNIEFLSWYTKAVKEINPDAYLVGEGWTDQTTYAQYYQSGIDSMFDFDFSGQEGMIAKLARGKTDASGFSDAMAKEEALYSGYNASYVNAPFYTNHDMARSAGYFTGDNGSEVKLAQGLNLMMGGNAFLYYGEEIGMKGSGKDENKRAPMYWTSDAGAPGMCRGPEAMDEIRMKYAPLSDQQQDPSSIWHYVREAVKIRSAFPVIARGETTTIEALSDRDVDVFLRSAGPAKTTGAAAMEPVTIVVNTSDETKTLDLSKAGDHAHTLAAVLNAGAGAQDNVTLEGGRLTIPAKDIAILTK